MLRVGEESKKELVLIERLCDSCGASLYKARSIRPDIHEYCEFCERVMKQSRIRRTKPIKKMRVYLDG